MPVVPIASVTPEKFYAQYVATRTPCILDGLPHGWHPEQWTLAALKRAAPDSVVSVEVKRDGSSSSGSAGGAAASEAQPFGHGNRVDMSFTRVLDEVERGSERFYLSAQELKPLYDDDRSSGRSALPALMHPLPPPMDALRGRYPLRPALLPTLVPQQVRRQAWLADTTLAAVVTPHQLPDVCRGWCSSERGARRPDWFLVSVFDFGGDV